MQNIHIYTNQEIYQRILQVSKKYWLYFVIGVMAMCVSGLISTWPSIFIKVFIDALGTSQNLTNDIQVNIIPGQLLKLGIEQVYINIQLTDIIKYAFLGLLLIFGSEGFFRFLYAYNTRVFGVLISNDFRQQLYDKLIHLDFLTVKQKNSGDLASCIINDSFAMQSSLYDTLIILIKDSVFALVFIITLLVLNWQLTLCSVILLPIFFILSSQILKRLKKLAHQGREISGVINSFVMQTVQGFDLIHLLNAYTKFNSQFQEISTNLVKLSRRSIFIESLINPFMGLVGATLIGGIAITVGYQYILNGTMTVGDFASYIIATLLLYQPVKRLLRVSAPINILIGSSQRIFQLLDLDIEQTGSHKLQAKETQYNINLKDISFAYNNHSVLTDINLDITHGDKVALIGNSGAGKSTLIRLLPALYHPTKGDITINNINLRDIDLQDLRRRISFVPQEPFLFSGNLLDNLLIARPTATHEEILYALQCAKVDFLDLDNQPLENIMIQERGNNFSGGQRQRLGLARSFLKNAPILILDEPTSALDIESENYIYEAITELMKDRTVIIITHDLKLIQDFNKIICLENGKIQDIGTHDELMKNSNIYRKLQ